MSRIRVSTQDRKVLKQHRWRVHKSSGYLAAKIEGKFTMFHRHILNAKAGDEIDHINRNRLDNRRSNLRFVTRTQNCFNHGKVDAGVHFHRHNRRWVVALGKSPRIYMGSYAEKADALYVARVFRKFLA